VSPSSASWRELSEGKGKVEHMKTIFAWLQNIARGAGAFLLIGLFVSSYGGTMEMVTVHPRTHERHLRNPGMGLILYGYADPLPERADVLYVTLLWADVEEKPGEYKFIVGPLKSALEMAEKHDRMVAVRVVSSWQNASCPIPKYLVDRGVRLFPKAKERNDSLLSAYNEVEFYEPEWWHPKYMEAHRNMVEAYGKALDGDPRIAYIDMRFYGYWGEGHRYHAEVPWPEDVDKREWCKNRIDEFMDAFKRTPLVIQTASDQNTAYPEGTAIDYALEKGAWMRRDGFGNYVSADESKFLKANWKRSLVIAENSQALGDFLDGNVRKWWDKDGKPITIDDLFDEMLDHRANYFPMGWSLGQYELVERERPDLWRKASLSAGYRMIVREASWPATSSITRPLVVKTTWRNTGVGRLPFPYVPALRLLDQSENTVATACRADIDVTRWHENEDQQVEFTCTLDESVVPGVYKVAVSIEDAASGPAVQLGIEGDDGNKRYVLGTINLE